MKTTVISIKKAPRGWRTNPQYVYIGRQGGEKNNPEKCSAGDDGYFGNPYKLAPGVSRGSTLEYYEQYLTERLERDNVFQLEFKKLKGKTLVCFCKPHGCHGDIMAKHLDK